MALAADAAQVRDFHLGPVDDPAGAGGAVAQFHGLAAKGEILVHPPNRRNASRGMRDGGAHQDVHIPRLAVVEVLTPVLAIVLTADAQNSEQTGRCRKIAGVGPAAMRHLQCAPRRRADAGRA